MARIIRVKNTLDEQSPLTYLSTEVNASGSALYVRNTNAFEASWGVQIGATGEETSEIKVLGTADPSGTTLNLTSALSFDHPEDTLVYAIKYNQLIFKRSTDGTLGIATAITNGTIDIQPDSVYTQFNDGSGASGYAYKVSFYNPNLSASEQESSDSDWITETGFSFYSLAKIRDRVKNKLFSLGKQIDNDDIINDWVNEWLEAMTNSAISVNEDYLIGTVDIAHGTNGLGTITESDFVQVRRVWFTTNGSDWYKAYKMDLIDYDPDETFNDTHPFFYMQGDNVFGKKPDGESGTARVSYYSRPTVLSDDTDELPVSMRSYTRTFVDYSLGQAYIMDGKVAEGEAFISAAEGGRVRFEQEISPRSKSGPEYINLVEPVDRDETFEFF